MARYGRGGGGGGSTVRAIQARGVQILAWLSWCIAAVGGSAIASMFLGDWIAGFFGWFPAWVAIGVLTAGVVAMLVDMFIDMVPNRLAIWAAILLPSVARSVDGKLGATVTDLSTRLRDAANDSLTTWLGTSSMIGLSIACVIASLLMARRVITKGGV